MEGVDQAVKWQAGRGEAEGGCKELEQAELPEARVEGAKKENKQPATGRKVGIWNYGPKRRACRVKKAKPTEMKTGFQAKRVVLFRALWDGVVTAKRGQNGKGVGNFLGHLLTLMSWYTANRGKLKLKLTPTSGVCLY